MWIQSLRDFDGGAARRQQDQAPRALAVDAVWPTRSPLSRFCAAERRSREHSSDDTKVCHHADELATLLLLTEPISPAPSTACLWLTKGCCVRALQVDLLLGVGVTRTRLGCTQSGGRAAVWLQLGGSLVAHPALDSIRCRAT